eukprot:8052950-Pyramimonas_sp.AAC.1
MANCGLRVARALMVHCDMRVEANVAGAPVGPSTVRGDTATDTAGATAMIVEALGVTTIS